MLPVSAIVSFRGSDNGPNWILDLEPGKRDFHGTTVHKGWKQGFDILAPQMYAALAKVIAACPLCETRVIVTGHSLGAGTLTCRRSYHSAGKRGGRGGGSLVSSFCWCSRFDRPPSYPPDAALQRLLDWLRWTLRSPKCLTPYVGRQVRGWRGE